MGDRGVDGDVYVGTSGGRMWKAWIGLRDVVEAASVLGSQIKWRW